MKRREMLLAAGACALGLSAFPMGWTAAADNKKKKILYFTRSAGFEHSVVQRNGGKLSHSEKILQDLGKKNGLDIVCSKDGRVFDDDLDQFDAIAFYTSGDLTLPVKGRDEPPMTERGKQRFLDAIAAGKGFVAFHAATDSFHSPASKVSDYVQMVGGEFVVHGDQQEATMTVVSPDFPGIKGLGASFRWMEEWYTLKNFAKDLHVILVQETAGMKDKCYQRPPFPATWARMHGKGRVYYTSLAHRENVWANPLFHQIILGAFSWVLGHVDAEIKPNIDQVTPKASVMPS